MENQNRLIEIMAELLQEQRLMRQEMVAAQQQTNAELKTVNTRLGNVEKEIIQIKENGFKVNLAIGELYRSVQQLNDQMAHFAEHENRIRKLEQILKVAW